MGSEGISYKEPVESDGKLSFKKKFFFFFFGLFAFSRAAPTAHGGSQATGRIGATAAGPRHSHSNSGSKPHLRPTPQLTAMPDP